MPRFTAVIVVTSKSFSENLSLRDELLKRHTLAKFNETGRVLKGEELIEFLAGCSMAIVGLEQIDEAILEKVPSLKVISKYGVGLDNIDLKALQKRGVQFSWKAGVNRRSVAELALHHMLTCVRFIFEGHNHLLDKKWAVSTGRELSSLTVGLVGFGHVGSEVARLLRGFGCRVIAHDILPKEKLSPESLKLGVELVDLKKLILESDVVSLHVPLTKKTKDLFDRNILQAMKRGSVLINTARGGIVDEKELLKALNEKHLSAAASDVFEEEPTANVDLLQHPRFFGTPHMGASSCEAKWNMGIAAINGLENGRDPSEFMALY